VPPTVYSHKSDAVAALHRDFMQGIDFVQLPRPAESSVGGLPRIDYRLSAKCFTEGKDMAARKCRAVFNITEQPAQPAFAPVPAATNAFCCVSATRFTGNT